MILLIDNYDSFVHNLARYFQRLGQTTAVCRNDAITLAEIEQLGPSAIVLSPGPRHPNDSGCCLDVVRKFQTTIPILGVCLGHQAIAAAFEGQVVRAKHPMHGRSSPIRHNSQGLFHQLPNPLNVGRYHSLIVDPATLPDCLEVTATSADGTIMALQHRFHPITGVQFHPESILTEFGYAILENFLVSANVTVDHSMPGPTTEITLMPSSPIDRHHTHPATF